MNSVVQRTQQVILQLATRFWKKTQSVPNRYPPPEVLTAGKRTKRRRCEWNVVDVRPFNAHRDRQPSEQTYFVRQPFDTPMNRGYAYSGRWTAERPIKHHRPGGSAQQPRRAVPRSGAPCPRLSRNRTEASRRTLIWREGSGTLKTGGDRGDRFCRRRGHLGVLSGAVAAWTVRTMARALRRLPRE